ncbi:MAG: arginine--tRNA ligase [Candidatus Micrarchaeota archaeon]|nr:arginine--tRNA ligase [Candidatus Micrarchaeota archaeon]
MIETLEVSRLRGYEYSINLNRVKDQKILDIISNDPRVERLDLINGYINIRIKEDVLLESTAKLEILNKRVSIEYPSVNPNKPWHIGHLRNALIGESMYRILKQRYNQVYRIDYIDDLGLQVAQSFWYFRKFGLTSEHPRFDHAIGMDYVKANQMFQEHEHEIREVLREMEENNIAREFVDRVLGDQLKTAQLYGIGTDIRVYESNIKWDLFNQGIQELKRNGYVEYVDSGDLKGTYVTKFNRKVIIRSDGTATYLGKDIVFQLWKAGFLSGLKFVEQDGVKISNTNGSIYNLNSDIIINVIGIEQSQHQQEIKELMNNMLPNKEYHHLAYQRVRLREGHFSGRKGNWLGYTADDLYDEGYERMNNKELSLAAIKFYILRHNPKTEVVFDWDKALNTQGGSGVYLLYTYVRMLSIERNASVEPKPKSLDDDDRELMKFYLHYRASMDKAIKYLDPSVVAELSLKLAEEFNSYYSKHRISNNPTKLFVLKRLKDLYEHLLYLLTIPTVTSI